MQDKNLRPYNKNGNPHGYWETYWPELWYKCYYVNWDLFGYIEAYYRTGKLIHKSYYAR